mgnify:CR=1 FL=1
MRTKNNVIISLLLLSALTIATILTSCGGNNMRPEKAIKEYLEIIEKETFDELSLTIYYIDPMLLTRAPLSVDKLINFNNVNKIVIDGSELENHIDLLRQISADKLKPVRNPSRINARIYYVFKTAEEDKILDIAMWGDNNSTFVNGLEVKENDVYLNIIMPFLTEEAKNDLEPYLRNQ